MMRFGLLARGLGLAAAMAAAGHVAPLVAQKDVPHAIAEFGRSELTQVTTGFQLGGEAYREVIFFRDQAAIDEFCRGDFELSAQVSAVAVKTGASANVKYNHGVAIFTMARGGLMYEASVGGQKFGFTPAK